MTKGLWPLTWALVILGVTFPRFVLGQEVPVSPEKAAEATQHYAQGKVLERRGSLVDACAEYTRAVELNPQFGKAHLMKGVCFGRVENEQSEMVEFQTALGLGMDFMNTAISHFNLGIVHSRRGEKQLAVQEFQSALKANPNYFEARWALHADQAPNAFEAAYWNFLIYLYTIWVNFPVYAVMFVAFIVLYPLTRIGRSSSTLSEKISDQIEAKRNVALRDPSAEARMESNRLSDDQIHEFRNRNNKVRVAVIAMAALLWALIAMSNSFFKEKQLQHNAKEVIIIGLPLILISYLRRLQKCPSCGKKLASFDPSQCPFCGVNLQTNTGDSGVGRQATRINILSDEQMKEFQNRRNKVKRAGPTIGIVMGVLWAIVAFSSISNNRRLHYLPYVLGASTPLIVIAYIRRLQKCPSCGGQLASLDPGECPHCKTLLRLPQT